jgi:hypothetical protein
MQGILEKENLETVLEMYAKENKDKQIVVEKSRVKKVIKPKEAFLFSNKN